MQIFCNYIVWGELQFVPKSAQGLVVLVTNQGVRRVRRFFVRANECDTMRSLFQDGYNRLLTQPMADRLISLRFSRSIISPFPVRGPLRSSWTSTTERTHHWTLLLRSVTERQWKFTIHITRLEIRWDHIDLLFFFLLFMYSQLMICCSLFWNLLFSRSCI